MDVKKTVLELAPHYAVMLVLVLVTLTAVRAALETVTIWIEMGVIIAVVFLYPFVIRRLGYAPSVWENR